MEAVPPTKLGEEGPIHDCSVVLRIKVFLGVQCPLI
jgi:hypothetical protein